ncbi:MAG: hypothetical protein QM532_02435 [Cyanobium sp. MAG06]|nr:hypothetical protein [Cyanobium sp. MAG06]
MAIPTNPYKILPHYDIVIDTTYHDNSHHYIANRMGIVNLINREQHQGFIRRAIAQLGVKIQDYKLIKRGEHCNDLYFANLKDKIHREMNLPIMVKSAYKKLPTLIEYKHDEIIDYIKDIHKRDDCIIEEFVRGKNYTVIAIKNIRGESVYLTSVYELIKSEYGRKILVANYLGEEYKSKIREITRNLCSAFDFNIMRIDFVINNNGMKVVNISTNQEYIEGSVLYEIFNLHGIS